MICTHGWNIGQAPEGYYYYYNTTTQGTCNTLNMAGLLNKPLIAIITRVTNRMFGFRTQPNLFV